MRSDRELEQFGNAVDVHLAAVKREASSLFMDGVPADKCVDIAITVVNAKALAEMRRLQGRGAHGIVGVRGLMS